MTEKHELKIEHGVVVGCSCGAKCRSQDQKRFQKRHPRLCSMRADFNRRLAQTVKSVED